MDFRVFLLLLFTTFFNSDGATIIRKEGQTNKIKVCVIGAGASGLSVGRRLLGLNPGTVDFTIFEQSSDIGGLWHYSEIVDSQLNETYPTSSAVYKSLKTNLPSQLMSFPGYPNTVEKDNTSFVGHEVIFEYLKNFTSFYNITPHIEFNARVENVLPFRTATNSSEGWKVFVKNLTSGELTYHEFDKVVVCSGHYAKARVPKIFGMENFKGRVLHSHAYRKPSEFVNKTVMVIGSGVSAYDISQDLAAHGSRVYLSTKYGSLASMDNPAPGLMEVRTIKRYTGDKFHLEDNSTVEDVDAIIYCTGYNYYYPFLKPENTDIYVDDNYVQYLYKHIVNVRHPSMTFVGLAVCDVPFLLLDTQAQYVAALIEKGEEAMLPAHEEMDEDSALQMFRNKDAHILLRPWKYLDDVAEAGKFPKVADFYRKSYDLFISLFTSQRKNFRKFLLVVDPKVGRLTLVKEGRVFDELYYNP